MPSLAARHVQALSIARRALAAGARPSTVGFLTGLDRHALRRYFVFDADDAPRPGKRPDSPERFVKNATLFTMIDASMVYAIYRDHRDRWPHPAEALLAAYAHYANRRASREIVLRPGFLRRFLDRSALGVGDQRGRLPLHALRPTAIAAIWRLRRRCDNHARDCPFCKLTRRYRRDRRLHSRFPERDAPQLAAALAETMTLAGRGNPSPRPGPRASHWHRMRWRKGRGPWSDPFECIALHRIAAAVPATRHAMMWRPRVPGNRSRKESSPDRLDGMATAAQGGVRFRPTLVALVIAAMRGGRVAHSGRR